MREVDVAVVGGGPAGLAVAIGARLAGLTVTVVDRARAPIDRACGEGLMPDAMERLAALGVAPPAGESAPFRGIRYLADGLAAEGRFAGTTGYGVRRTALHRELSRRAEALGAELHWRAEVTGLDSAGVTLAGETLPARFVVGADGRHSAVRRWAGLVGTPPRRGRHAVRRHYEIAPWTDLVEVHWGEQVEAYVTPVAPRCVDVAHAVERTRVVVRPAARPLPGACGSPRRRAPRLARPRRLADRRPARVRRRAAAWRWSATPPAASTRSPARGSPSRSGRPRALVPALVAGNLDAYARSCPELGVAAAPHGLAAPAARPQRGAAPARRRRAGLGPRALLAPARRAHRDGAGRGRGARRDSSVSVVRIATVRPGRIGGAPPCRVT